MNVSEKISNLQVPVVFKPIQTLFQQFSQVAQLAFGFALGLAFSHSNITVGWVIFWIFLYEFIVFLAIGHTIYYSLFFRIVYNFVFLASILIGQQIYFGHTIFQDWLYPDAKSNIKKLSRPSFLNQIENIFDSRLEDEEKNYKKWKLSEKYKKSKYR